jgi:hypothetical protein
VERRRAGGRLSLVATTPAKPTALLPSCQLWNEMGVECISGMPWSRPLVTRAGCAGCAGWSVALTLWHSDALARRQALSRVSPLLHLQMAEGLPSHSRGYPRACQYSPTGRRRAPNPARRTHDAGRAP